MNMNVLLLHAEPAAPVHWLEHWADVMLLGGGLFVLLIVAVWVYLKETERRARLEER